VATGSVVAASSIGLFLDIVGSPDTCLQCNRFRLQLGRLTIGGRRACRRTSWSLRWRRPSRRRRRAKPRPSRRTLTSARYALRAGGNRGKLPTHLPRIEMMADVPSTICPCCRRTLHRIGEDVSERLDVVPAQFRVLVVRRPKDACRACSEAVVQAPAPARLIEGGLPTEATVAHVLVSKFADHLPLYRQAQTTPARALPWIARPWPTGWGALPSCCGPCTNGCSTG
jgi:transposase